MNTHLTRTLAALSVLALAGVAIPLWTAPNEAGPPPPAADRGGVRDLLYARPFQLEQGFEHSFRVERPLVTAGWVVVLDVDPARVVPRQTLEPVLYVGDDTAERFNHGWPSGRVVALVPAPEAPGGGPGGALAEARAWFGPPELPERVDAAALALELGRARQEGVAAVGAARAAAALERGGAAPLALPDREGLDRLMAELVLEWAPGEEEFARSRLVPRAR